eukprot:6207598-Pyramimonas_sp.AAC.1
MVQTTSAWFTRSQNTFRVKFKRGARVAQFRFKPDVSHTQIKRSPSMCGPKAALVVHMRFKRGSNADWAQFNSGPSAVHT